MGSCLFSIITRSLLPEMVLERRDSQESRSEKKACAVVETDETVTLARYGVERRADGLINWQRDCKTHPRNWSVRRKTFDTTVIILFELYT